ncbi:MAG TPA: CRTAC1 family protein [Thermoanaerobaculia bacterium]|nr:CRTAC1 family protein [Thermoanaerobaculia bacterium]
MTEETKAPGEAGGEPVPEEELVPADDRVIGRALRRSLVGFVLLALAGAALWLLVDRPPAPEPEAAIVASAPRAVAAETADLALPFADVTSAAGIGWSRENGAEGDKLLPETMGGGAAWLDYDGDGREDLLLVNGDRWPGSRARGPRPRLALYRNEGGGRFRDVAAEAGLDRPIQGMGAAVGDYDSDGRPDLFLTAVGQARLYRNLGGRFEDVTARAGVGGADDDWSTAATFFDLDNDGDLDLFVGRYVRWSRGIDLEVDYRLTGVGRAYGPPTQFEGAHPILYRNEGDGAFADVSETAGIRVVNPATGVAVAKTLAVLPVDVDRDGRTDLVVANDTVANFLFRNLGDGRFEEIGTPAGIAFDRMGQATGAMGIDAGDLFGDDSLGILIGNFANEMSSAFVSQGRDLLFADESIPLGLGAPTRTALTFGLLVADFDLDGRLDVVQANGHLEEEIAKVDPSQSYRQPAQLFLGTGGSPPLALVPPAATGDLGRPLVCRGIAAADYDGDGYLDLVLIQPRGEPLLLRNDQASGRHWLEVALEGDPARGIAREAIGARVEIEAGGRRQSRIVARTRGYLCQSQRAVHFGLGDADRVERLTVRWPGGAVTEQRDVAVDQKVRIGPEPPPS